MTKVLFVLLAILIILYCILSDFFVTEDNHNNEFQEFPYLPVELGEQIINIEASFTPILIDSLTKDVKNLNKHEIGSLQGLLNWTKPFKTGHPLGAKSFSIFLPSKTLHPGTTWWIVQPNEDEFTDPLTHRRYFPPFVESKFHPLFVLLSIFHPRPFLWTRFQPQGTCAILRATGKNFYDIVFRIHAEFQLNEPPLHPFWFTPSQFQGRLIINKDSSVVKFFEIYVPNRTLNVDMEWLNGPNVDSMEVDIGHIPEMSLISSAISIPSKDKMGANESVQHIKWNEEISLEEAYESLELAFFPFKKVKYYNMLDAFERAKNESKLVHGIVLWGNLDDQSC